MAKHPVRFGIYTSIRPLEWEPIRDLWQKADQWGYDSLWHCDHFYQAFPPDPDGPCLEGWTTITAPSQLTKRARIGVLVKRPGVSQSLRAREAGGDARHRKRRAAHTSDSAPD